MRSSRVCTLLWLVFALCPDLAGAALRLRQKFDLASPNGCGGETMTARQDAVGRPFLYVAAKDAGLRIYALSAKPRLVATLPVSALGSLDVNNIAQSGQRLFLALGDVFSPTAESPGVAVIDVSDPAAPLVVDLWLDPALEGGAGVVAVEGDYAYLGAMGNGLIIFAIDEGGELQLLSRFVPSIGFPDVHPDPRKINARGMAVRDGIVYLAYDAGGLRIVDARDRGAPVEIGRYSNPVLNGRPRAYNNVILDGSRVYVTVDYCGLEVLDVGTPAAIRQLSWWNPWKCPGGPFSWFSSNGHTNEIAYDSKCKLLFMSAGKSDLEVVSVANPSRPVLRSDYPGVDNRIGTWGVSRSGDRLYLSYICTLGIPFASNWSGVRALTYRDPSCGAAAPLPAEPE